MATLFDVVAGIVPAKLTCHLLANAPSAPYDASSFTEASYYGYKPAPLANLVRSPVQDNGIVTLTGDAVFSYHGTVPYYHPAGMYVMADIADDSYLVYLFLATKQRNIVMIQGETKFLISIVAENL